MREAGVLDDVEEIFAVHVGFGQTGQIGLVPGVVTAGTHRIDITIKGKGTHASTPHLGIDPIVAGSDVVGALQTVRSRKIDPTEAIVVSVCQFHGGTAANIIPDDVEMSGTVRIFSTELEKHAEKILDETIKGITSAHGANYEFNYSEGYPVGINSEKSIRYVEDCAKKLMIKGYIFNLIMTAVL